MSAEPPERSARPVILLVDDDIAVARPIALMLQRAGYGVVTVHSFNEALDVVSVTRPSLIISDANLGDGQGAEIARRLRGAGINVAFLLISGDPAALHEAAEAGLACTAFLQKPFSREELLVAARDALVLAAPSGQSAPAI